MRSKKLRSLFWTFLLSVMTIALFGCGGKGVDSSSNKKVIKTIMSMDIDSLDPYKIVSSSTEEITMNVFEGLVMPSDDGGIRAAIADNYTVSPDGKTYTFKIKKNIKFHNGNILDIKDVEFSLNRMSGKTGEKMSSSAFSNIDKIEVVNDDTINITLKEPDSSFIYHMTEAIVPDENKDSLDKVAIGTGPFKIVQYEKEQKLVLEKFDDYYGEKAKIDRIELLVTPNAETAFLKLLSGEINFLIHVDSKRVKELKDFDIISGPQNLVQLMGLNHKFAPFADKRVREAINLAIDKDKIIASIMDGYGEPLDTNMSPVMKKLCIDKANIKRDTTKAKELLKEAGYENLTFTIRVPSNYNMHVNTAQMISEQLKDAGVTAKIETMEWSTWLSEVYTDRKYEATVVGLSGKLEPDAILGRYTTNYKRNFFNYSDPRYDELIAEAKVTNDEEKRTALYKKAEEILRDNAVAVYIMDPNTIVALKHGIKGYVFYPIAYINFSKLTIGE